MEHEYALLGGQNRSKVGRYLYTAASAISAAIVFAVLAVVDVAKALGWHQNIPPGVMSLAGAATVYLALYWAFDTFLWKVRPIPHLLKLPDLSGKWDVEALQNSQTPPLAWSGEMTIVQSWDKLRIRLRTGQSFSDSIAAALQYDSAAGYRLLYHYRNQPRIEETDLTAHHGFGEILFERDGSSGEGEYFNGRGRNTWGTMKLKRKVT